MKTSGLYDTRPNEFIKIPQGTTFCQMARIFATQQCNLDIRRVSAMWCCNADLVYTNFEFLDFIAFLASHKQCYRLTTIRAAVP